jgi:hypothetical protein
MPSAAAFKALLEQQHAMEHQMAARLAGRAAVPGSAAAPTPAQGSQSEASAAGEHAPGSLLAQLASLATGPAQPPAKASTPPAATHSGKAAAGKPGSKAEEPARKLIEELD